MDIQRLRNLTTGRLHTDIKYVYKDLEMLTGEMGLMTHMLPRARQVILPWLKENVKVDRFWDGKYDVTHVGEYDLPMPTKEDQKKFIQQFLEMPNPFLNGKVLQRN